MRATVMYGKKDVRVENVRDATIESPTDAVVRVTRACVCGSDLWPYNLMEAKPQGQSMGHEAIGIVEALGADVQTLKVGDLVIMPFAHSDGTCPFCHEGLQTACVPALPQVEANGVLHIAGFFAAVPPQVNFELIFAPVESQWRLSYFGFNRSVGTGCTRGAFCTGREGSAHRRQAERHFARRNTKGGGKPESVEYASFSGAA